MSHEVTFVTPTYAGDFERFCLQQESIERLEINIPQVAVVQDEDRALFDRLTYRKNLTIVSTRDVLPAAIESRRLRKHWAEAIVQGDVTEYMTYGVFARHINQLKLLFPVTSTLCFTFWPGMERIIKTNFQMQVEKHGARAASIQSSIGWPVALYRPLVEQMWAVSSSTH